jgi:hypothetical protein
MIWHRKGGRNELRKVFMETMRFDGSRSIALFYEPAGKYFSETL